MPEPPPVMMACFRATERGMLSINQSLNITMDDL